MKKNTAGQAIGAQLVTAADGTAFTGSVTVEITGDNGTQTTGSVGSGVCTHEGNGYHSYAPAQAETNFDHIAFTFHGTGAVPVTVQVYTSSPQTGDAFARLGAPAGASVSADLAAVKGDTAAILTDTAEIGTAGAGLTAINLPDQTMNITGDITGNLSGSVGSVTGAVGSVTGSVGSVASYGTLVADIATAVWGATTRTLSAFSTSLAVSVWDVLASAVATASSIGLQIKTNLDAAVSTRSTYAGGPVDSVTGAVGSVTGLTASDVGAIKAKTDLLPAAPAAVGDIPTALQNADALLKRDMSAVTGEAARSPLNALRFLRNKWSVVAGLLTVTKEDDTTTAWTAATTADAAADPVTAVDPT